MIVKWSNVAAFALLLFAVILAVTHRNDVAGTVAGIARIGPQYPVQDRTFGLLVLGLILVSVVAVVRLLISRNGKE